MGFTIFIFSLIIVANMIPSLLVGLQRTTAIDYDAVAYRTAVILAEDPGHPMEPEGRYTSDDIIPWDFYNPTQIKEGLAGSSVRFGLAVSRENPNVLSQRRISRFFDPLLRVEDIRDSLIFGQINYGYNVTLTRLDTQQVWTNGTGPYPEGRYGYIRRYVNIKEYSVANVTNETHPQFQATTEYVAPNNRYQYFRVNLSGDVLYKKSEGQAIKYIYSPAFNIDLTQDNVTVNLDLEGFLNNSHVNPNAYADLDAAPPAFISDTAAWALNCVPPSGLAGHPCNPLNPDYVGRPPRFATLRNITFEDKPSGGTDLTNTLFNLTSGYGRNTNVSIFYDRVTDPVTGASTRTQWDPLVDHSVLGEPVGKYINVTIGSIPEDYFDETKRLYIIFRFSEDPWVSPEGSTHYIPRTLLGGTFLYDYSAANVTQPALSPGILEVAVW